MRIITQNQEVVMKHSGIPFLLALIILLTTGPVVAQEQVVDPAHQTAPTVTGGTGTGLFQTYSSRTLRRGQYNFGVFWQNYDRDPGDLDINRVPVNFAFGVTNRFEVFANFNVFQQVTSRQPYLLSGSGFNQGRIQEGGAGKDPFVAFGPPVERGGGAAYFPGTGNRTGSILPPVGGFAGPIDGRFFVPFNTAGYYNEFPFFPFGDSGGPRMSSNGLGDISLGLKMTLTNPDRHFSLGAAGLFKIPSSRNYDALADGRGAGAFDGGPILIMSQHAFGQRLRIHQNIGYMITGGVQKSGVTILDRRDELVLNAGIEIAPMDEMVYVAEWNNTVYVGSGTPNLNPVNPMDLRLGARFYFFDGRFHLGGAWQTFLNNTNERTMYTIEPGGGSVTPLRLKSGDVNGFVFHIGYGKRPPRVPPPPPNRAPSVNLESDKTVVLDGDSVQIYARASDPDNDILIYTWTTSAGQILGAGPNVTLDTTRVNPTPGDPPVEVKVVCTVDDGRGCSATSNLRIMVNSPTPPPVNRPPVIESVTCSVIGSPQVPGRITDGEAARVTVVVSDPDGDPLTYQWRSTTGTVRGTGRDVTLDTTNVTAGPGSPPVNVTVTVRVDDGRGGTAEASTTCTVYSVKKPDAIQLEPDLLFPVNSARVDNLHKAILDDVALRMQQEPSVILVVDGHQDQSERRGLSRQRAENVKRYLATEKGIDPNRIVVREFGDSRPDPSGDRKLNRRVELWLIPSGADIPQ